MQAKERVKSSLDEFSRAHGGDNPIDPTPENLEKWLEQAYPRDADGVSIREQIDVTTASEKQWVQDLVDGKVCPLAAKAFDPPDRIRPARVMRGRVMITDHCHRQERFIIRPSY